MKTSGYCSARCDSFLWDGRWHHSITSESLLYNQDFLIEAMSSHNQYKNAPITAIRPLNALSDTEMMSPLYSAVHSYWTKGFGFTDTQLWITLNMWEKIYSSSSTTWAHGRVGKPFISNVPVQNKFIYYEATWREVIIIQHGNLEISVNLAQLDYSSHVAIINVFSVNNSSYVRHYEKKSQWLFNGARSNWKPGVGSGKC